jgi:hypothetical protein
MYAPNDYTCLTENLRYSRTLTAHTSLSPIRRGFAPSCVNYKKGCTRLAAARDKVYQLLAHGRWFSPGVNRYGVSASQLTTDMFRLW